MNINPNFKLKRINFKLFALSALVACLSSCASSLSISDLNSEERMRFNQMKAINSSDIQSDNYKTLGSVQGIACKKNLYASGNPSQDQAILDLRLNAVKLGATAITNLVCEDKQSVDWSNNCWQTVVCIADAINVKSSLVTPNSIANEARLETPKPKSVTEPVPNNKRIYLAVMPFKSNSSLESESSLLTEMLTNQIQAKNIYRVLERSQADIILKEQGFQQSGACDNSDCAVEIGKLLTIDQMILGSIGMLGASWVINTRVIDVKTGEILSHSSKQLNGGIEQAGPLISQIAEELTAK